LEVQHRSNKKMNTIELITKAIKNKIADMHIAMPAKIVAYDFALQKAQVQPALYEVYNDEEAVKLPIIHNVPVLQPSSGGASITMPVLEGDAVMLMFSERSLEEWLATGAEGAPDDQRTNDLTDAVAILGLKDFSKQSPALNNEDLLIKYKGSSLTIKPDGVIDIEAQTMNLKADNVDIAGDLTVANITASGDIEDSTASMADMRTGYNTHFHNHPQGPTVGPPDPTVP